MRLRQATPFELQWQEHLFEIPCHCPYGLDFVAVYRQLAWLTVPPSRMDDFLAAGFRRNGNTMYTMNCRGCKGCVPIRLRAADFRPNRNQRRTWAANQDLLVNYDRLRVDEERLALCDDFLAQRHSGRGSSARDYYSGFFLNSIAETYEITYRLDGRLLGLAVVDLAGNGLNAVYFFFAPDQARRSLGTFNILYLIELCRRTGLEFLYLGYWIENVAAMSYKTRFKPYQLRRDGVWQE